MVEERTMAESFLNMVKYENCFGKSIIELLEQLTVFNIVENSDRDTLVKGYQFKDKSFIRLTYQTFKRYE